ncbi:MAG: hypothetical protein AAB356_00775, partial [Deltaproteobacteria bacterium]
MNFRIQKLPVLKKSKHLEKRNSGKIPASAKPHEGVIKPGSGKPEKLPTFEELLKAPGPGRPPGGP